MSPESIQPAPVARKVPRKTVIHGEELQDDYFWLRDKANPGVIEYIEAENRYTNAFMKPTQQLQKRLFNEMLSEIKQTDQTVPDKIDDYFYYSRTEEGKQYPIYCRKKGSLNASEQIILDVNTISEGNVFFNVDICKASPNHDLLMYLADATGSERNTLMIKDLKTGELLSERISDTSTAVWGDNKTVFYSTMDVDNRPFKVFRHIIGTDHIKDALVLHETDPAFFELRLWKSKTKEYLFIQLESATTSEVYYLKTDNLVRPFNVLKPRKHGVVYSVVHHEDRFFIITNEDAINYKIMEAPISDPSEKNWKVLVPHSNNVSIDFSYPNPWVDAFRDFLVIFERENAVGKIRIMNFRDRTSTYVALPEPLYHVEPVETHDFDSGSFRFRYSSPVTPPRIYDCDMHKGELHLKKQQEVPGYDPSKYQMERILAGAKDGVKIPLSIVYRKGTKRDGKNPAYLYGYGAYGDFEGPAPIFRSLLLPLLDRGFVCAHAHVRGGGDFGKRWHEDGRMMNKINSFTDFCTCAEHLVTEGYTSSDRLVVRGRSAGGLLMGAVTNLRPDLFKVVVAEVPFVDAINTMLDPSIPLTVGEFEEWGNPLNKEQYDYIKRYSPYDNVERKAYPNMLVTGALNDARVQYWEPAKWVAKLRAMKTNDSVILLRTNIVEGHSGASGRFDYLKWFAFMYAFIFDRLGISD